MLAGGDQGPQRSSHAVVSARVAQVDRLERQDRCRDAVGIEGVGLAGAAVGSGVHPGGFDNLVAGLADRSR